MEDIFRKIPSTPCSQPPSDRTCPLLVPLSHRQSTWVSDNTSSCLQTSHTSWCDGNEGTGCFTVQQAWGQPQHQGAAVFLKKNKNKNQLINKLKRSSGTLFKNKMKDSGVLLHVLLHLLNHQFIRNVLSHFCDFQLYSRTLWHRCWLRSNTADVDFLFELFFGYICWLREECQCSSLYSAWHCMQYSSSQSLFSQFTQIIFIQNESWLFKLDAKVRPVCSMLDK